VITITDPIISNHLVHCTNDHLVDRVNDCLVDYTNDPLVDCANDHLVHLLVIQQSTINDPLITLVAQTLQGLKNCIHMYNFVKG